MRYSTLILALAATISAQSISDLEATIPACAQSCLTTAVAAGGCSATDFACQCGSGKAAITAAATDCITKTLGTPTGCTIAEALTIQSITDKICAVATAIPAPAPSTSANPAPSVVAPTTAAPASIVTTKAPVAPSSAPSAPSGNGTWSTVYSTKIYTITSCAPTVTNCPAGKVTTEVVSVYTTFCPYSTTYAPAPPAVTTTAIPAPPVTTKTPITVANSTLITSAKGTTTSVPIQVTGAASSLNVGSFLGAVAAFAALAL